MDVQDLCVVLGLAVGYRDYFFIIRIFFLRFQDVVFGRFICVRVISGIVFFLFFVVILFVQIFRCYLSEFSRGLVFFIVLMRKVICIYFFLEGIGKRGFLFGFLFQILGCVRVVLGYIGNLCLREFFVGIQVGQCQVVVEEESEVDFFEFSFQRQERLYFFFVIGVFGVVFFQSIGDV